MLYSLGAAAALAYFIAGWGAAYYLIGLSVLFVFILVLLKRYSQRMLINYSITFGLALFIGTKVPYISLSYLISGAVLPVVAVFIVLLVAEILRNNISMKTKLSLAAAAIVASRRRFYCSGTQGDIGGITGKFITVLDPFIRAASPLVDSVAEQRISAWGNLYLEFGIAILFFILGLYFVLKKPNQQKHLPTTLRGNWTLLRSFNDTSTCSLRTSIRNNSRHRDNQHAKTILHLATRSTTNSCQIKTRMPRVSKEYSGVAIFLIFMILATNLAFSPQTGGVPRAISQAYVPTAISSSSLPIGGSSLTAPVGAWLDAIHWMQGNVKSTDVVVMWWDYGNWLSDLGNVTSLADNTTTNATQIQNVGFIFMGNENQSMAMLNSYGQNRVKYIAVFEVLQISQASAGRHPTLQVQQDTEMKANGYGWQESQDKIKTA